MSNLSTILSLRRFSSTNRLSTGFLSIVSKFDEISSLINNRIPPPCESRSTLSGELKSI